MTILKIPITKLLMGDAEVQAAAAVIRSGWLAMGAKVKEFELEMAATLGAKHAVAVSSGTAALHLVLHALRIGPGDEVLVPSLSYIATANAVLYTGARPVFVEVDRRTFNLDPACAASVITPRTRAVLAVHQLGLPAELQALRALARQQGLALIEDGACALGATYHGERVGARSEACCFSFHPRKVITTGEGGMITTDDDRLAELLRVLRGQGMSVPAEIRHDADRLIFEEYHHLGFNYRLTDVQAAIGLEQLKRLPFILQRRRALAERYTAKLGALKGVLPPIVPEGLGHSFQSYMILLEGHGSRRAIMEQMLARGIATRRGVMAIHRTPYYQGRLGELHLPITEDVEQRGLILPLYPELEEGEQDHVIEALAEACGSSRR